MNTAKILRSDYLLKQYILLLVAIVLSGFFIINLFFNLNKAKAEVVCGIDAGDVNLLPVNRNSNGSSGNDGTNPMLEVKTYFADPNTQNSVPHSTAPEYRSTCNTAETYRIMNDKTNVELEWNPQMYNFGTAPSYNLVYQIAWFRMNNAPNSCVNSFADLNVDQVKFPQTLYGTIGQFVENFPSWQNNNANIKKLNHRFVMKDSNGNQLPDGWYQVDIMPGCQTKGTITWETNKSIGAFFVRLQCTPPGSIPSAPVASAAGSNAINLNWRAPNAPGGQQRADVVNYTITRVNATTGAATVVATVPGMPSNTNNLYYTDNNPPCGANYYYRVTANGCNDQKSPVAQSNIISMAACNCTVTDDTGSYCASSGFPKVVTINGVSNPQASNLSVKTTSGVTIPGINFAPVNGQPNKFLLTSPTNITNAISVVLSYNNQCSHNFTAYPNGKLAVNLQLSENGCNNLNTLSGIDGKTVTYVDNPATISPPQASTNEDGEVNFSGIPIVNQNSNTCGKKSYQIKIAKDQLEDDDYEICPSSLTTGGGSWDGDTAYFIYNVPTFGDNNPSITAPTIYFTKSNNTHAWVSLSQGNFVVSNSSLKMKGLSTDLVINRDGTVITKNERDLEDGKLGSQTNNVYGLTGYKESFSQNLDKILKIEPNKIPDAKVITGDKDSDCVLPNNNGPSGYNNAKVLYISNCNLKINSNGDIKNNIKLVIVKNGQNGKVEIGPGVDNLDQSFVVDNDFIATNGTADITINGYLWVKNKIYTNRRLNVNSQLEYINNNLYKQIIDSSAVHNVNFD